MSREMLLACMALLCLFVCLLPCLPACLLACLPAWYITINMICRHVEVINPILDIRVMQAGARYAHVIGSFVGHSPNDMLYNPLQTEKLLCKQAHWEPCQYSHEPNAKNNTAQKWWIHTISNILKSCLGAYTSQHRFPIGLPTSRYDLAPPASSASAWHSWLLSFFLQISL